MLSSKKIFFLLICLEIVVNVYADTCINLNQEIVIEEKIASAAFFANLRTKKGSINFETSRMIDEAKKTLQKLSKPNLCGNNLVNKCKNLLVKFLFKSTPAKFLENYKDQSRCENLLQKTTIDKILYKNKKFNSEEEARTWYNKLSQGEGEDGQDLYKKCPGRCSPQYLTKIHKAGSTYELTTEIICGHARDKDNNEYKLVTSYLWYCGE